MKVKPQKVEDLLDRLCIKKLSTIGFLREEYLQTENDNYKRRHKDNRNLGKDNHKEK